MSKLAIINPAAGVGVDAKMLAALKCSLDRTDIPYHIIQSEYPGHLQKICSALDADVDEVIIAGGDGSVQECIRGLLHQNVVLTVLPSGTGNDLFRSLHMNDDKGSLEAYIDGVFDQPLKRVNVCLANDAVFVNVASMGLDAAIVELSLKLRKWIHSSKTYLLSALIMILFYRPRRYRIHTDGREQVVDAYLIAVGNGQYYGGGMRIMPKADLTETELDICLVKKMNRFRLLRLLPTVYSGDHLQFSEVIYWKAHNISITPENTELLNMDGELQMADHFVAASSHAELWMR